MADAAANPCVFSKIQTLANPLSAPKEWYLENTGPSFCRWLVYRASVLAMLYQMTGKKNM